ncbi:MAG TPA: hypothetical protein VNI84_12210 [Pyrinomonadaceae bacterium]|nr:hypothetical protein [Pyrinomonadaceae bacterium]
MLPFPVAEGNNSKNTASVIEKNPKSYAFSVHNSGNPSTLLESKFQKHSNQYLPGKHPTFDWSNVRANLCLQSAQNREEANLSHALVFQNSQSDRAPPII